ncbi:MAG: hypothetical protein V2A54_07265 [Bacteroidota bacterium]
MKKNLLLSILVFSAISANANFQTKDTAKFGIRFSGFVNAQYWYDTRQTYSIRETQAMLYPLKPSFDKNGVDINEQPSANQVSMMSRLHGDIFGPDAFGAKASAVLEGDFTGPSNIENNAFRLRHAYIKLDWKKSQLMVGQYWHPLNVPEMIPDVASLNTGAPFHPFSRQPQVRYKYTMGNLKMIAVASSQRDYASSGPSGTTVATSTAYSRNAVIPNLHFQLHYAWKENLVGVGGDYKVLKPRLVTDSLIKTNETVESFSAVAFAKIQSDKFVVKLESVLGQNLNDHLMLGGYAVADADSLTNIKTYTTLNILSAWADISTTGTKWQFGVFAGYLKNLGTMKNIRGGIYAMGSDIESMYRVSPRVSYLTGKLKFSTEVEYTVAFFGTPNSLGEFGDVSPVANIRALLSLSYNF